MAGSTASTGKELTASCALAVVIVHHAPTDAVRSLTDAMVAGARDDVIEGVDVVVRSALEGTPDEMADAVLDGIRQVG